MTSKIHVTSMRRSHQLGQILKGLAALINDLLKRVGWSNCADDDLVLSLEESLVCLIRKLINGHTECSASFTHMVMQLGWERRLAFWFSGRENNTHFAQEEEKSQSL